MAALYDPCEAWIGRRSASQRKARCTAKSCAALQPFSGRIARRCGKGDRRGGIRRRGGDGDLPLPPTPPTPLAEKTCSKHLLRAQQPLCNPITSICGERRGGSGEGRCRRGDKERCPSCLPPQSLLISGKV